MLLQLPPAYHSRRTEPCKQARSFRPFPKNQPERAPASFRPPLPCPRSEQPASLHLIHIIPPKSSNLANRPNALPPPNGDSRLVPIFPSMPHKRAVPSRQHSTQFPKSSNSKNRRSALPPPNGEGLGRGGPFHMVTSVLSQRGSPFPPTFFPSGHRIPPIKKSLIGPRLVFRRKSDL